jgi:hypothetical protein
VLHTSPRLLLLTVGINKDEVKVASNGIMLMTDLVKIGPLVKKLNGTHEHACMHTHTHTEDNMVIS